MIRAEEFSTLDLNTLSWEEIQQGLSQIHRFSGAGISVAEHSLRLYRMAYIWGHSPAFTLACLLHDVEELVGMVDIPRPEKEDPFWASIVNAQRNFGQRVFDHYKIKLNSNQLALLKQWDTLASWVEARALHPKMRDEVIRRWGTPPDGADDFRTLYYSVKPEEVSNAEFRALVRAAQPA
jgi:hypothetical protein